MNNRNSYRINAGRPKQQRGFALLFAFFLLTLLAALATAIDIGRLYLAQRTLQQEANIAALDAARVVSQCHSTQTPTVAGLTTSVEESLARNGVADPDASYESWVVEHGNVVVHQATQFRQLETAPIADSDAVRVTLQRVLPTPIMPFLRSNPNQPLTASATATQSALGSLSVGSTLLGLEDGIVNALLSALLGGNVTLGAVGYQGLLDVDVTVETLALALGLTVQDLSDPLVLQTETPLLGDLIDDLATELSGIASAQVIGTLQALASQTTNNVPIPLDQILQPVGAALGELPIANLGELLLAAALATYADPGELLAPIALPLSVSLPGVTSLESFIRVIEPPQFSGLGRAGEVSAQTSQIRLMLRLQVAVLDEIEDALNLLLLGGLLGSIDADPINLGIDVEVANASAFIDYIQCPTAADPTLSVDNSAIATVADLKLGTFSGDPSTAPAITDGFAQLLGLDIEILGGLLASITVNLFLDDSVETTVGDDSRTDLTTVDEFDLIERDGSESYWQARVSPAATHNPQTLGSSGLLGSAFATLFGSLSLSATDPDHPDESSSICLLRIIICTLSIPVGSILDAVLDPVTAVLGALLTGVGGILDAVLDPLLSALGLNVGSATVTMGAVVLDQPHLVSTSLPVEE